MTDATLSTLPVLPTKNTVLFPHLLMPLSVGRPGSRAAVEAALATEDKTLLLFAQRDASVDEPGESDLFPIGTKAIIKKVARTEHGLELIVQGVERVALVRLTQTAPHLEAVARALPVAEEGGTEVEALHRAILEQAAKLLALVQPQATIDFGQFLAQARDPLHLVYLLGSMVSFDLEKEQNLLASPTRLDALRLMHGYLGHEIQVQELRVKITSQAQTELSKQQREYVLRQQMRAIQEELGEAEPEEAELAVLRKRFEEANLPEVVRKEAERLLKRLESLPPAAPDYQLSRTHLDLVLELPWATASPDALDLRDARRILDEDHYDLQEVKGRILEHLAVLKLNPNAQAPILCLVGPPGVGKTSLGQSIARAMGRKFERLSLGGMHDEAELRGHRRTYIGAMPGRIIQSIRRAGVNNPVLLLDEVDKLGRDFRGDPAAALLEVLDPAQNSTFRDNYLDLPFDLSRAFFITTANTLETIPQALLDRMEVLRLAGYSEEEKIDIARRYLLPRQIAQAGLKSEELSLPLETLQWVIRRYTREAGLRQLERALGRLTRRIALRFAEGQTQAVTIGPEDLTDLLGPERFFLEKLRHKLPAGVSTGLAWTEAGGDVLYIEATQLPEGSGLTLTGQLGQVMQESAKAAQSYMWAHAEELGIDHSVFRGSGLHLHVPAGAIPKDGPSAGVAMATALTSLYTHQPVAHDTAMTGEVTLTGLVLPVGGIKEKVLAARRAGVRRIILPRENKKDLRDIPDNLRQEMEFIFVERMEEVLAAALPGLTWPRHNAAA